MSFPFALKHCMSQHRSFLGSSTTTVPFPAEEGPPLQLDLSYYSYEYDPDPYASEADVFEMVAELTTVSTFREADTIQEVVTTIEW